MAEDITIEQMEFAVFCIENIAEHLGLPGDEVYRLLTDKSDLLDNYIFPCWWPLHTQSREHIVEDIVGVMKKKEVI